MANIRQRRNQADFIDTAPGKETPAYALMGTGFKTLDENPAAQTKSRRYVNDKSTTKSISGYDYSLAFDADQIREQAAVDFIIGIAENECVGEDAETWYIRVDLDKKNEDGTYHAKKRRVAVEVGSFTNDDGEMGCTGNLLGVGDWIEGKFDIKTKTFTANKAEDE